VKRNARKHRCKDFSKAIKAFTENHCAAAELLIWMCRWLLKRSSQSNILCSFWNRFEDSFFGRHEEWKIKK
jgi:hypothetical protein